MQHEEFTSKLHKRQAPANNTNNGNIPPFPTIPPNLNQTASDNSSNEDPVSAEDNDSLEIFGLIIGSIIVLGLVMIFVWRKIAGGNKKKHVKLRDIESYDDEDVNNSSTKQPPPRPPRPSARLRDAPSTNDQNFSRQDSVDSPIPFISPPLVNYPNDSHDSHNNSYNNSYNNSFNNSYNNSFNYPQNENSSFSSQQIEPLYPQNVYRVPSQDEYSEYSSHSILSPNSQQRYSPNSYDRSSQDDQFYEMPLQAPIPISPLNLPQVHRHSPFSLEFVDNKNNIPNSNINKNNNIAKVESVDRPPLSPSFLKNDDIIVHQVTKVHLDRKDNESEKSIQGMVQIEIPKTPSTNHEIDSPQMMQPAKGFIEPAQSNMGNMKIEKVDTEISMTETYKQEMKPVTAQIVSKPNYEVLQKEDAKAEKNVGVNSEGTTNVNNDENQGNQVVRKKSVRFRPDLSNQEEIHRVSSPNFNVKKKSILINKNDVIAIQDIIQPPPVSDSEDEDNDKDEGTYNRVTLSSYYQMYDD